MIFFYKNFYPSLYYKTLLIAVQIFNVKDLRIMAIVNTDGHIYIRIRNCRLFVNCPPQIAKVNKSPSLANKQANKQTL